MSKRAFRFSCKVENVVPVTALLVVDLRDLSTSCRRDAKRIREAVVIYWFRFSLFSRDKLDLVKQPELNTFFPPTINTF